MSDATVEAEKKVRDKYSKILVNYGLKPTLTQIYLTVFFSTKPITLKEIADQTGYSLSNVSTHLKLLERLTDIERHTKPGSKTNYFTCNHNIKDGIRRKISQQKKDIKNINETIKEAINLLEGDDTNKANVYRNKLTRLSKEYDEVHVILDQVLDYLEDE
ncbi:MAG: winged helix-turn-helix transcriptional regulator [Candidatus Altiarchaeales archaeon]|nr:winged helix-turn-helix transcriptional regulator [Candidatus Altiarchaeales archaeon]